MFPFSQYTLRLAILGAMTCLFAGGIFAQSSLNQIVRSQSVGNDFNIYIDPYALELFGDSVLNVLNPDGAGDWNTWKDILSNGNSPGMDVNFDGNTAFGLDSLLVEGSAEVAGTLNVTGQTTISTFLASGTATFTGKVKGANATADDEFVTYGQLDSLASVAPFNETYRLFKNGGTPQTVTNGSTDDMLLSGFGANIYAEVSAQAAAQTLQLPFSVQAGSLGGQVIALSDPGVYEAQLTVEVEHNGAGASDVYVLVELYNHDALQGSGLPTTRLLAGDASILPAAATFGAVPVHCNTSMTFIADNSDEEVYVKITPTGGDIDVVTFGFSVARKGEN